MIANYDAVMAAKLAKIAADPRTPKATAKAAAKQAAHFADRAARFVASPAWTAAQSYLAAK